ncbi:flagellar biosynthesis protein FlhF [Rossellomorea aquimaris]|uniref:flagellar biosynthesis protein FlhF n=1 Tax=Rossellomorea aquimaris TaxID=189382 RepID=UPI001CD5EE8B|nr:flagellar biosynthesis protein FlhF [Rossellomorea aquimaris]MCA1053529.1 flagellar biosynthesis protein FlhF [Rossellomorea aquimaris]
MKVLKYVAPTMNEAMKKVRNDLGDEAVILNSKVTHTGGIFGLFRKKMVEVIAAADPGIEREKAELKRLKAQPPITEDTSFKKMQHHAKKDTDGETVQEELKQLKSMIASITASNEFIQYHPVVREPLLHLQAQGLHESLLMQAGEYLQERFDSFDESGQALEDSVLDELKRFLSGFLADLPMGGVSYKNKYINVLGPTGVGKTTTLAKMAAEAVIDKRMKVGFITTDTYRIAAIEQLKTYAGLLNVPVEVVYKLEDFKKAVDKFKDYDHVFIDTAGRNFRDEKYVKDLHRIIDFKRDMETFLVLSLTSKEDDMKEIIEQFSSINISRYIFTKLDETSSYGSMVNIMERTRTGAGYVTTGQNVPEDIIEANAAKIGELLLKGFNYERSSV